MRLEKDSPTPWRAGASFRSACLLTGAEIACFGGLAGGTSDPYMARPTRSLARRVRPLLGWAWRQATAARSLKRPRSGAFSFCGPSPWRSRAIAAVQIARTLLFLSISGSTSPVTTGRDDIVEPLFLN
jgi:hypothetical protein